MFNRKIGLALMLGLAATAQDLGKLPEWARLAAQEVAGKPMPDGDAWVVLDRTEMAYTGDGEIRTRKFRLAKILTERGLNEAGYWLHGLGGKASKVKKLRGWNLRPDGELEKLSDENILNTNQSSHESITTRTVSLAVLPRAAKGSWIAFESQEVFTYPTGPTDEIWVMESHPIHRWELALAKQEGWFTNLKQVSVHLQPNRFEPWIKNVAVQPGQGVKAVDLPAIPEGERAHPSFQDVLPSVRICFEDPKLTDMPSTRSWDEMARFYAERYRARYSTKTEMGIREKDPAMALQAIRRWMTKEMSYRQVYLSPERGWIPEYVPETLRKRYGDCKDLATCFISEARSAGMQAYPVLARINEGHARETDPVSPHSFNHVIVAVRLEKSLGFPAEVETPQGRFLMVDPTDRMAPLGSLHGGHRDQEVLICQETGALWVRIPANAVKLPRSRTEVTGQVTASGRLDASVTLVEEADALGLRQACLDRGVHKIRDFLLESLVDLPPTGSLEVQKVGDPFDVGHPFEVTYKISHPDGFHRQVGEATLVALGLPHVGDPIQKPGKSRLFPVEVRAMGHREFHATLQVPWAVAPVLPTLTIRTPFRTADWTAKSTPGNGGCTLELDFYQERQDAFFDFPDREKGVAEWKRDRGQLRILHQDGLAFKVVP